MDLWLLVMGERVDEKGSIRAFGGKPERNVWLFFFLNCDDIFIILCCQKSQNDAPKPNFIFCK